jgi:uncharacterized protein
VRDPAEGVSADGLIVTGAQRDRVPAVFEPVLAAAAERLPSDASLYLYGSVATGQATPGRSDVDLVALGIPAEQAAALSEALNHQFAGLCRGVEIAPAQPEDFVGQQDEPYGNRVFLRHYCVHLLGPDPQAGLPRFPADARAARGFNGDIAQQATRWRDELRHPGTSIARLGQRVARKTLLAVAGLVSVHDETWTTDRSGAARRWSVLHPELAVPLAELKAWSDRERPASTAQVQVALGDDGVVRQVETAFAGLIGLWPVPRRANP